MSRQHRAHHPKQKVVGHDIPPLRRTTGGSLPPGSRAQPINCAEPFWFHAPPSPIGPILATLGRYDPSQQQEIPCAKGPVVLTPGPPLAKSCGKTCNRRATMIFGARTRFWTPGFKAEAGPSRWSRVPATNKSGSSTAEVTARSESSVLALRPAFLKGA